MTRTNVIGREALVRHQDTLVGVRVIDSYGGENRAKRVRVTTGELAGTVLMPGSYKLVEFCDPAEVPKFLQSAWGALWGI